MQVVETIEEVRAIVGQSRGAGQKVALVPTMGFLHDGHLSLVKAAKERAELVIVSIFLNPTQFNDPKDFEKYPRDLQKDLELLKGVGTSAVFCPHVSEIYSPDAETWVNVDKLSTLHEGEFRPGHFRGVTTVVNILFNCIAPDVALFGEKDFQQLGLIKKMVSDLRMPIEIIGCPTIREQDGLAMSSRNARLNADARKLATCLSAGLWKAQKDFLQGQTKAAQLESIVLAHLADAGVSKVDYVRVIDPQSFEQKDQAKLGDRIVLAAWVDGIRLIDNIAL